MIEEEDTRGRKCTLASWTLFFLASSFLLLPASFQQRCFPSQPLFRSCVINLSLFPHFVLALCVSAEGGLRNVWPEEIPGVGK